MWEGGSRGRLIHVELWQKPVQCRKAINLQLKTSKCLKKRKKKYILKKKKREKQYCLYSHLPHLISNSFVYFLSCSVRGVCMYVSVCMFYFIYFHIILGYGYLLIP